MLLLLTLPDGTVKEFSASVTGFELAESIGKGLAAAALAVKADGDMRDLSRPIERDARVEIVTRKSPEALELIRHDAAHILAQAVQELFPGTQVTIGPNVENGFYYDFARAEPFSTDDFPTIEAKMREIVARDEPYVREELTRDEAIKFFDSKGEKYKVELIRDLPADQIITVYAQGAWKDLCRGPHSPSTGKTGAAFKLLKLAGAYWRGDSKNAVLHRIYGTAWRDEKELQAHLMMLDEAEKALNAVDQHAATCMSMMQNMGEGPPAQRTCAAADRTGHAMLHTLYGQALKAKCEFFIEYFAIDLVRDDEGRVRGIVCLKLDDGTIHRFRAAITQRCVSDWASMWASSDFALFTPTWFRKPPFEDPGDFARRSPASRLSDVTTPLMVIHSEEDWRCPIGQGEAMFRGLAVQKKPVVMVRFPGESHELSRAGAPSHRVQNQRHIRRWFDHWLQDKPAAEYGL